MNGAEMTMEERTISQIYTNVLADGDTGKAEYSPWSLSGGPPTPPTCKPVGPEACFRLVSILALFNEFEVKVKL